MVVDGERHAALSGPFLERIENGEQVLVQLKGEFWSGTADALYIKIEIDRQAETLKTGISQLLHVAFVVIKSFEAPRLKPAINVGAAAQMIERQLLQRVFNRDRIENYQLRRHR